MLKLFNTLDYVYVGTIVRWGGEGKGKGKRFLVKIIFTPKRLSFKVNERRAEENT